MGMSPLVERNAAGFVDEKFTGGSLKRCWEIFKSIIGDYSDNY